MARPRKPTAEKRQPANLKLPAALLADVDRAAEKAGVSRQVWLEAAVRAALTPAGATRPARAPARATPVREAFTCPQHGGFNRGHCLTVGCTKEQRRI